MKFVVEAGRFRPWNTGFRVCIDNFLVFLTFVLAVGLALGYLEGPFVVIKDFVMTILGTLVAGFVVPNFVIDFWVGTFFFFVTIFFFFGSGAFVVYVNIV